MWGSVLRLKGGQFGMGQGNRVGDKTCWSLGEEEEEEGADEAGEEGWEGWEVKGCGSRDTHTLNTHALGAYTQARISCTGVCNCAQSLTKMSLHRVTSRSDPAHRASARAASGTAALTRRSCVSSSPIIGSLPGGCGAHLLIMPIRARCGFFTPNPLATLPLAHTLPPTVTLSSTCTGTRPT